MTNLFKRFFTHKSKFLLIIISLLGLAFSYSCSCRDNPVAPPPSTPEGNNVDPKFFTIYTNAVTNLLVQKADGTGFNYQPSIKFSEANNNAYTVSASTEDTTFKNKLKYDEKTGLISLSDYNDLATEKKTITITFNISATNSNLSNSTTNFTLDVGLKKTQGTLDTQKVVGKLFKDIFSFTFDNATLKFETEPEPTQIVADVDLGVGAVSPKEMSQKNFDKAFQAKMKETAEKKKNNFYKSIVLTDNYDAGSKRWSFNYKFTFSDEDYDLTDEQKQNGIEYVLIVSGDDANCISWIDKK